jgi:pimeloyl-ACP methyl ester carboxylesterase
MEMRLRHVIASTVLCFLFHSCLFAQTVPKDNWTNFDGSKVYYYDIGNRSSKSALILIHGWTCSADFWKASYNAFPSYRVIAIDLPGHGKSGKPKLEYTMAYFARSIEAVMKEAKVERAVLVGHSMGTPVARQFYRLFPAQTVGIVSVDGPLQPFGPSAQMQGFFAPLFNDYKNQSTKFIDGLLGPVRQDIKTEIRPIMLAAPDYVAVSAMKSMLDDSIWTNDQINVPVLAIMAKNPMYPPNIEDGFRKVAPDLEFHMWDGVSHFLFMEKPKEFNETVDAFITKHKLL